MRPTAHLKCAHLKIEATLSGSRHALRQEMHVLLSLPTSGFTGEGGVVWAHFDAQFTRIL